MARHGSPAMKFLKILHRAIRLSCRLPQAIHPKMSPILPGRDNLRNLASRIAILHIGQESVFPKKL
jgi:hypothetical protein